MDTVMKFTLRLPVALYAALKAQAVAEHRSLHAQIIHILSGAVRP